MRHVVLALLLAPLGCERVPAAKKPTPAATAARPAPAAPRTRPADGDPPPAPSDDPRRRPAFALAWDAAWETAAVLDRAEPEATRKALARLTGVERREAEFDMKLLGGDGVNRLASRGFAAFLARTGRDAARSDPDFRVVAEAFWSRDDGPAGVLEVANRWAVVAAADRRAVADAVRRGLTAADVLPRVRDAVLALGGDRWLTR